MLKCGWCSKKVHRNQQISGANCGILMHSRCTSEHLNECNDCYYNPDPKIFVSFDSPAENESAKKRLEEQDAQMSTLQVNLARSEFFKNIELNNMKQKHEATLKERDEEIATLKKSLEGSQTECAEFKEKIKNLHTVNETLNFELQEKLYKMSKRYQKMRNQIGKNIKLEEQLDKIKQNLEATLKERDEEIAALKKSLKQSQKNSGALQEVGSFELQEQTASMQKFLEETQRKCTELQEKMKHFNTQHENIPQGQPGFTEQVILDEDLLMRDLDFEAINLDNNAASSAKKRRLNSKEVTAVCPLKPEDVKTLEEAWLAYMRGEACKVNKKQWTSILKPQTTNGGIIKKPESALKATPAIIKIPSADHENKAPAIRQTTESKLNPGVGGGGQAKPIKQELSVSTQVIVSSANGWSCHFCTFLNPDTKRSCERCARNKDTIIRLCRLRRHSVKTNLI